MNTTEVRNQLYGLENSVLSFEVGRSRQFYKNLKERSCNDCLFQDYCQRTPTDDIPLPPSKGELTHAGRVMVTVFDLQLEMSSIEVCFFKLIKIDKRDIKKREGSLKHNIRHAKQMLEEIGSFPQNSFCDFVFTREFGSRDNYIKALVWFYLKYNLILIKQKQRQDADDIC